MTKKTLLRSAACAMALLSAWMAQPAFGQSSFSTQAVNEYNKALTSQSRFGIPRYATAQLPACVTSNLGALAWDTTTSGIKICNGSSYVGVSTGGGITIGGAISGGTDTSVLFDNAGVIGENPAFTFGGTNNVLLLGGSTLGSELAPALTAGNWTVGAGWESPIVGPGLIKNADGTGTQTPSAATTIVAGVLYKVQITLSAWSVGSATYTLGGEQGASTLAAATTYTNYVRASTTGKLIITPTNTSRFTISAISIKAVSTPAAGSATCMTKATISGASTTENFLNCTGTTPTTLAAITNAIGFQVTGAGSSSFTSRAVNIDHLAGYTGASDVFGLAVTEANATTGTAVGFSSTVSAGTKQVGGYFGLAAIAAGHATSALVVNNGAVAGNALVVEDNGSAVFTVADGGVTTFVGTLGGAPSGSPSGTLALGASATVSSTNATAIGNSASAGGNTGSIAIGNASSASTGLCTAIGYQIACNVDGTTVIGQNNTAHTLQLGGANAASPTANTIQGKGSRGGTDSNVAGGNLTIQAGIGTGNGAGAQLNLNRDIMGASGSTAQSTAHAATVCESKTLSNTTGTATAIANITLPNNSAGALRAEISVQCNDGTNFDSDIVTTYVAYVNKAGTLTIGTPVTTASAAANNSGSCTVAPTIVANGTTSVDLKVTPVITTITPTTTTALAIVHSFGGAQGGGGVVACK